MQNTLNQEELEKQQESNQTVEELFQESEMSFEEAQQRSIEENKTFSKTEFFRMDKLGTYRLRILPLAPSNNEKYQRKGYEYPTRSLLLEINKPSGIGDGKPIYTTVPRTIDAGFSVDLIDTYRKLAVDEALARGNEDMADKIAGGSFGGGLKFNYSHSMYILDLSERAKGIQLLSISHAQFKSLEEQKFNIWQKLLTTTPNHPCPISSIKDSFAVEICKKKKGSKTEYSVVIDVIGGTHPTTTEELSTLVNAPRIPEITYRYSRYQLEATVEYLRQCDQRYDMSIMETTQMLEAIETLSCELPKEDTSSFSFDKRTKGARDNASKIIIDDLFNTYEELEEEGLGDKTEEGQTLREMIRTFIEQEGLKVRMSRTTSNKDLLDMIEKAYSEPEPEPDPTEEDSAQSEEEQEEEGVKRTRRRK